MSVLNAPGEVKVGKIATLRSGITISEERTQSFDLAFAEPAAPLPKQQAPRRSAPVERNGGQRR